MKKAKPCGIRRILALLLLLALLAGALAGCGRGGSSSSVADGAVFEGAEAPEGAGEPEDDLFGLDASADGVDLTDMLGRQVPLDRPARRIVALSAAECEIVYALGGGDLLVGRGEYCDYPAQALELPAVQSGSEMNLEQIVALEPDLVIMSDMGQTLDQVEALENAGLSVIVCNPQVMEGVYRSIGLIGEAIGKSPEAEALAAEIQSVFDQIAGAQSEDDARHTVYFEISPLEYGLWAAGNGTFMGEMAAYVNLENIFADLDGWGEISQEQVIQRNPDYIVTVTMYYGDGPTPEEEIASRPGWEEITAVREGNIIRADSDEMTRPGPRLADGLKALQEAVRGGE